MIIEVQGKVHALLEEISKSADPDDDVNAILDAGGRRARRRRHRHADGPARSLGRSRATPLPAPPRTRCTAHPHPDPDRHRALSRHEARPDHRRAQQRTVLRPGPRPDLGHPARRRHLPGLDLHHVPAPASRSTRSANAAARPAGPPTSSPSWWPPAPNQVWSWDITKLARPAQVDLVPALRDPRRLQPLRRRLARRPPRIRPPRRRAHRRRHLHNSSPAGQLVPARRPRQLDDLQDRHPAPRRPRRAPVPLPAPPSNDNPYSEAQFKTLKYSPDVPETLRQHRPRPQRSATRSSTTTTTSTATPASACTPPPTSTTAAPTAIRAQRQAVLDAAYTAHPERFRDHQAHPRSPRQHGSTNPRRRHLTATAI